MQEYIPDRGDFIRLNLNPRTGHEQSGWRPVLVLSPSAYNEKAGLVIACPITNQAKGYPFEVRIEFGPITGAVLADQVRCLDWRIRKCQLAGKCEPELLVDVLAKINALIDP